MPDFGVSHLAGRQTDVDPTGAQAPADRSRRDGHETASSRATSRPRSLPLASPLRIDAPTITNYQNNRSLGHGQQIRLKFRDLRHKNESLREAQSSMRPAPLAVLRRPRARPPWRRRRADASSRRWRPPEGVRRHDGKSAQRPWSENHPVQAKEISPA